MAHENELPQRVLLSLVDPWTCALLRAALIERGHDAVCVRALSLALVLGNIDTNGFSDVLFAEEESLSAWDRRTLAAFHALGAVHACVVLASASAPLRGDWDYVLRRPIVLAEVVRVVDEARKAPEPAPNERALGPRFSLRSGPPWPMIRCAQCAAARDGEVPRTAAETQYLRSVFAQFVMEHEHAPSHP